MGMIISWLTSKVAGPVLGALAAMLLLALVFVKVEAAATEHSLRADLKTANAQLDQSRKDLDQCQANRKTLQASIDDQNKSVDALKAKGDADTARANEAVAKARATGSAAAKSAAAILTLKPATSDLCKAAEAVLTPGVSQ